MIPTRQNEKVTRDRFHSLRSVQARCIEIRSSLSVFVYSQRVLMVGKIEHLQHYFAVSGKLDQKGYLLFLTHRVTSRAGYAPTKSTKKSDSTYSSLSPSPEVMDFEIPLPPERDSTSPTPTAPKPESMKETRGELLSALIDCEHSLMQGRGLEIVENTTATIRLAQRYRAHVRHEDLDDEKKLRRDAVDVLYILRRITEREDNELTEEEKSVIRIWCNDVKTLIDRDDEIRREMWERAAAWMEGNWENNEWGIAIPGLANLERYHLFLVQFDPSEPRLPPPSTGEFFESLRSGTKLCLIHNTLTHFSLRPFGLITRFHTDTSVRYRVTDNLRYFAKAAQIRWEIQIEWDVEEIWRASPNGNEMLKRELGKWCTAVIDEMHKIYQEEISEGENVLDELIDELGG